jgi:8-oxo-dGTP pyrophosphatase MutT (NUDIX family)
MIPTKACPVLVRTRAGVLEVLAFEHPLAGRQLVKGSIENGETPAAAALRELGEEAGVTDAHVREDWGVWDAAPDAQVWAVFRCEAAHALPDRWTFRAEDDGGHDFRFFWQPIPATLDPRVWHPMFQRALAFVAQRMASSYTP